MRNRVVIGSRGSKLAVIQAESVAMRLKELNSGLEVEIRQIMTEGDHNHNLKLDDTGSTGIFVKALEEELINGGIDLAVHSLKDLPTTLPDQLYLTAVTQRLDPRDTLVAGAPLRELKTGSRIGTGSRRRSVQLHSLRPDLEACAIRGNVDTRLRKVAAGEIDGIIVATAAMLRLGWVDKITEYLPLESFLPCVGQGTLALEARREDRRIAEIAIPVNHLPTWQAITAERAFLHTLGGGCRAPIAALSTIDNEMLIISGMVADPKGKRILKDTEEGSLADPAKAGISLAGRMLNSGAAGIINEIRCQ